MVAVFSWERRDPVCQLALAAACSSRNASDAQWVRSVLGVRLRRTRVGNTIAPKRKKYLLSLTLCGH